jgi:hypothetical protein
MSGLTAQLLRRRLAVIAAAAAAAALLAGAGPAAAQARASASTAGGAGAALGGAWGTAIEVPGLAALNTGGNAYLEHMSCPSAGSCTAGGYYTDSNGATQSFVVSEVHGTWGKAKQIPGTAALNQGGIGDVGAVSCATAGNCSAGGSYSDSNGDSQAFVANEVNGTWGTAEEVPGTAALNTQGHGAAVFAMSCPSAGNCSAGGIYAGTKGVESFVVSEVHGTWGTAKEVPGIGALNAGGDGELNSLSCATAGNCSAGGYYVGAGASIPLEAFVVTQTGGHWGTAQEVPGTAALNIDGGAQVSSVSCASPGNCTAGGFYSDSSGQQAFAATQANGTWGNAKEVPGTAALNTSGNATIAAVSCASPGNCSADGSYDVGPGFHQGQAFVANEVNGTWGKAKEIPGTAALNAGGNAGVAGVSCASAGNCSVGGSYTDSNGDSQVFVANEVNGTWGQAKEIPGTAALNAGGNAGMGGVSCAPAGTCSVGGFYAPGGSPASQAFVVNKT